MNCLCFFRHEDGSVNFWDVSQLEMCLIYTLQTAKYFVGEHEGHESETRDAEEEVWPPFKKVGNYCPYSDDPRFAVTKIILSPKAKSLTVAGNGGQVLIFDLSEEETSVELQVWHSYFVLIFLDGNMKVYKSLIQPSLPESSVGIIKYNLFGFAWYLKFPWAENILIAISIKLN